MTQLPSNGSNELQEQIQGFIYDEIDSELENDSMYKNVWKYNGDGSQTSIVWRDKATQALEKLFAKALAQKDREILEARLDELRNSIWENYDSIYDAGDVDKAMGKIKERIAELTEQINKAKQH